VCSPHLYVLIALMDKIGHAIRWALKNGVIGVDDINDFTQGDEEAAVALFIEIREQHGLGKVCEGRNKYDLSYFDQTGLVRRHPIDDND